MQTAHCCVNTVSRAELLLLLLEGRQDVGGANRGNQSDSPLGLVD